MITSMHCTVTYLRSDKAVVKWDGASHNINSGQIVALYLYAFTGMNVKISGSVRVTLR